MKRIFIVFVCIFLGASVALGDMVDDRLPKMATEPIKISTRQMIKLGLNSEDVIEMTRRMIENNFRHEQVMKAHSVLMNAHKQDLPIEPMMNKAHEGMAKQVQDSAVVEAMAQVQSRYAFSSMLAKAITKDKARMTQFGKIIVDSLSAGMHSEDAERIMQALHERARHMNQIHMEELATQTFMTARMMARLGHSSMSIADSLCQGLQDGYGAKEMHDMRNSTMTNSIHSSSKGPSFGMGQQGGHSGMSDSGGGMGGHGGDPGHGGPGGGPGGGHM